MESWGPERTLKAGFSTRTPRFFNKQQSLSRVTAVFKISGLNTQISKPILRKIQMVAKAVYSGKIEVTRDRQASVANAKKKSFFWSLQLFHREWVGGKVSIDRELKIT